MADPFAEFQQVEESKLEGEKPKAVTDYIENEQKKMLKANSFSQLKDCFPAELQEQAERQFYKRQSHYASVRAKEDEIEGITERLYTVRFDSSASQEQILQSTKNLLAELNRLNEELAQIRESGLQKFIESLELDDIGVSQRMKTSSFRTPSRVSIDSGSASAFNIHEMTPGSYGFMRTASTAGFESQPPNQKWKSLYKMYKEWRFQKDLADAQRMASQGVGAAPDSEAALVLLQEEKSKLRSAIYAMRQRKNLTASDEKLLEVMQQKLKALNNIR